jgi:hypothetical protein
MRDPHLARFTFYCGLTLWKIYVGMKMSMEVVSMNVSVISGFRQGVIEIWDIP